MSTATNTDCPEQADPGEPISFPAENILVSATDERGIITYANDVFCSVAGYSKQELMKAPHKIVRHKDMPKGAFYLVWSKLKQGKPVGAYVKNRSKTGDYYWVYSVITPMAQGFLSVRIKPQSSFFDAAKPLYQEVLAREQEGLPPDRSSSLIRSRLQGLGFATYSDFMGQALDAEYGMRATELSRDIAVFRDIEALSALVVEMRSYVNKVGAGFKQVRGEPVNLRILAGRLEGTGAALATISQNYDAMAKDMYELVGLLNSHRTGALSEIETAIARGKSALNVASLMEEAAALVVEHEVTDVVGKVLLQEHHERLEKLGRAALCDIAATSLPIPDICRRVRRRINGLDVVKLLCKVESGRLRHRDGGLEGIIERLEHFHDQTDRDLVTLMTKAIQIRQNSATL